MAHRPSVADTIFRKRFDACQLAPPFSHEDHVRLAYVYLTEAPVEQAYPRVRETLRRFLAHHGVDPTKYHETMTKAWLLAVRHFMEIAEPSSSARDLMLQKPRLLDSRIMLRHYSEELLFSARARADFVDPDLLPIPRYTSCAT